MPAAGTRRPWGCFAVVVAVGMCLAASLLICLCPPVVNNEAPCSQTSSGKGVRAGGTALTGDIRVSGPLVPTRARGCCSRGHPQSALVAPALYNAPFARELTAVLLLSPCPEGSLIRRGASFVRGCPAVSGQGCRQGEEAWGSARLLPMQAGRHPGCCRSASPYARRKLVESLDFSGLRCKCFKIVLEVLFNLKAFRK